MKPDALAPSRPDRAAQLDERRAARRVRLIDAAIDVYGEVGYRAATVRAICARAGLTERYFYESFASNEALLVEAASRLALQMNDYLIAVREAEPTDRDETTARVLRAYYRTQLREASKARVFTLEFRGICEAADREFERILDRFAELFVTIRDPAGTGRAATDRLLRRGIVGGVLQITLAWIEGGYAEPLDSVVRAAASIIALAD